VGPIAPGDSSPMAGGIQAMSNVMDRGQPGQTATPMYSTVAERALIALCATFDEAIEETSVAIAPADFGSPKLRQIYQAILKLHEQGLEVSLVSMVEQLRSDGTLDGIGGETFIRSIIADIPGSSPKNFIRVVTDYAVRRRIASLSDQMRSMAADPSVGVHELINQVHQKSAAIDLPDNQGLAISLRSLLQGEDTPYDWVIPGLLERKDRTIVVAPEGYGKALDIYTSIPTPSGLKPMLDIQPGDQVFGIDGKPIRVITTTGVIENRPRYRIDFADGAALIADEDHQWVIEDRLGALGSAPTTRIMTTAQIEACYLIEDTPLDRFSVAIPGPLEYDEALLPADPYTTGKSLGEKGCVLAAMTDNHGHLLLDNYVHISDCYLYASIQQRWDLLRGLADAAIHTVCGVRNTPRGGYTVSYVFSRCGQPLLDDIEILALSLGLHPVRSDNANSLSFRTVFPLPAVIPEQLDQPRRVITAITALEPGPVKCIQVDAEDGVYLAGEYCVPTHNSTLLRQVAVMAAGGLHPFDAHRRIPPIRTLIIDLENRERQIRRRINALADSVSLTIGGDESWMEERCHLWVASSGIHLQNRADVGDLVATIKQVRPDLITCGPLYKMATGNPADEEVAKSVADVLDMIAVRYNAALLIEAHAPHGQNGSGERELRPFGASLWMRWPEFGIGLYPSSDGGVGIRHWRGQREEREWPARLIRGRSWPWEVPSELLDPQDDGSGLMVDLEEDF